MKSGEWGCAQDGDQKYKIINLALSDPTKLTKLMYVYMYVLVLKNSDNFRRRRRRNLSNLPPATAGYRRDPGHRLPSPVSLAFTGATGSTESPGNVIASVRDGAGHVRSRQPHFWPGWPSLLEHMGPMDPRAPIGAPYLVRPVQPTPLPGCSPYRALSC